MSTTEEIKLVDLDALDFKALARAYKIFFFRSIGKCKVLELYFGMDDDIESYDKEEEEMIPEVEEQFKAWLVNNPNQVEMNIAYRMITEEMWSAGKKKPAEK